MKAPRKIGKVDQLIQLMNAGEWEQAIRLAGTFPELGDHKDAIKAAHGALTNRRFYEQLGKNVEKLIEEGIAALKDRYAEYPQYKESRDARMVTRREQAKEWATLDEKKKQTAVREELGAKRRKPPK